jgi:hypothetical protein
MDELDLIGKAVNIKFANCTVLCTGDLLVGKKDATTRGARRHDCELDERSGSRYQGRVLEDGHQAG